MHQYFRSCAVRLAFVGLSALVAAAPSYAQKAMGDVGAFAKWAKIEITFDGPSSSAAGDPNPFSMFVDVTFTSPSGRSFVVPGFYDGDGQGGSNGSIWKVRFSADEVGAWTFRSASARAELDGYNGSFTVTDPDPSAPDFYRWGRLEAVGTPADKIRYLKFRDGGFWLKAGCDDPENFLGSFSNYDTVQERKEAVDYLSARGINSMYIMTHNINGDNNDVWPWLGSTSEEAKANGGPDARFDIPKLHEWLDVFEHMQRKGMVVYLVLQDDASWSAYDHARYYRELVARFAHLPALIFNFMEEYNERYTLSEALGHMETLASLDPYDHPRGIHNVNRPSDAYIDSPYVDFTAIQTQFTDPGDNHDRAVDWINACKARGRRVLMVGFDEARPILDRKSWWSAYLGGAVWEAHVDRPYDRPMSAWATVWHELGGARAFMESVPFWEMEPSDSLVLSGTGYCLAKPGEAYAAYLPNGGEITLRLTSGVEYRYDWWNPDNGFDGAFQAGGQVTGGDRAFQAPGGGDWALRVVRVSGTGNSPPVAHDSNSTVASGDSVQITLGYDDPDGPGPYTFSITQQPSKGTLTGSGQVRTYTPNPGATGQDSFQWKVNDSLADSNTATATVVIVSGNQPPVAQDQTVETVQGTPVIIPLAYEDADGPGPYTFTITRAPANGTVVEETPGSNDYVYTPEPGFVGTDTFQWKVNDGQSDSNVATVTVHVAPPAAPPSPPANLVIRKD